MNIQWDSHIYLIRESTKADEIRIFPNYTCRPKFPAHDGQVTRELAPCQVCADCLLTVVLADTLSKAADGSL